MTDAFRHRTTLQVRFRDIDAFGHVNNAVFFSYLELARIRYLLEVLQPDEPIQRLPLILARVELDFRSPITFGEDVVVETRVDHVGRTSFGMQHRMTAGPDGRLGFQMQDPPLTTLAAWIARGLPADRAAYAALAADLELPLVTDDDELRRLTATVARG